MQLLPVVTQWIRRLLPVNEIALNQDVARRSDMDRQALRNPQLQMGSASASETKASSSGGNIGNISLSIGERFQGTVLEYLSSHTAIVQVKGALLQAYLETPLPRGEKVPLVVVGRTPSGLSILQKADEEAIQGEHLIPLLLSGLQIADTPLARQVVRDMLAMGVTVSQENLSQVLRFLQEKGLGDRAAATAVRLLALRLPLHPAVYQALDTLWQGPSLHRLLQRLRPFLENQSRADLAPLPMEDWIQLPAEEKAKALQHMRQIVGISHEADIMRLLFSHGEGEKNQTFANWKAIALRLSSAGVAEEDTPSPSQGPDAADVALSPLRREMVEAAQTLLDSLTGQQLLHTAKNDPLPFFYHFFALPLQLAGQERTAEIHFLTHRGHDGECDPANSLLVLRLDLPRLGPLTVTIQSVEKIISLRFQLSSTALWHPQEDDVEELRRGLQAIGYRLGSMQVEEAVAPASAEITLALQEFTRMQVDVRI